MPHYTRLKPTLLAAAAAAMVLPATQALASSHREAPFIASMPREDGTDFYAFKSYEAGHEDRVVLIANYLPLQDPNGGPNYFDLDDQGLYEIHVDNNGDAVEDLSFRFRFQTVVAKLAVDAGGEMVEVPLKNIGPIGPGTMDTDAVNVRQTYTVDLVHGDRRTGRHEAITDLNGGETFIKPMDNIGNKSIPDYAQYAAAHVYDVAIPGCGDGRMFVGQRQEGFAVSLGEVFDLVNLNPLGPVDAKPNPLSAKNVTSIALEVPASCLATDEEPVIGAWTTASVRQARVVNPHPRFGSDDKPTTREGGPWTQVSRLGMPLVNEVVIGLADKDAFNASEPKDDAQFATYVTNPTLPELLEILFPGTAVAPNQFPREDLVAAFLTGVEGLNQPANVVASEMLRLNTGIEPTAAAAQSNLGVLGGDLAGFPNGRRPGDDVVDIELRVAMGALIDDATIAPNNTAPLTDGVTVDAGDFDPSFPFLTTPLPGAVNP